MDRNSIIGEGYPIFAGDMNLLNGNIGGVFLMTDGGNRIGGDNNAGVFSESTEDTP